MRTGRLRACIMGYQVGYSRSPLLHGYWLRTLGIDGAYELIDVAPDAFGAFFRNLRANGYAGGNITKPHKGAAFRLVDRCDAAARAVGAVNCVWYDATEEMVGTNTDVTGYLANLDEQIPGWDKVGDQAVVIGAGGAAAAIVYALLGRGFRVAIVNRTLATAVALATRLGPRAAAYDLACLPRLLGEAAVLTNASPLGSSGQPPLEIDLRLLARAAVVCDLVYVPVLTGLLRAAAERGHRTADGLGMLMHQAAPSFARWFGVMPAVTAELRALLASDIAASR